MMSERSTSPMLIRGLLGVLLFSALILFGWTVGYRRGLNTIRDEATTLEFADTDNYLVVYRLGDLVGQSPSDAEIESDGQSKKFDRIVKVIRANVESGHRKDFLVRSFPESNTVVVSASPEIHRLTADVLENIREFPGLLDDVPN